MKKDIGAERSRVAWRVFMKDVTASTNDDAPICGACEGIQPDGSLSVANTHVYAGEAHVEGW